jgi:four helix bundle protein
VTPQELSERSWQFAGRIAKVVDALADTRVGRHVAGQIVRSGIAAAPNYDQARSGESRADFVHKVNVALKELAETRGWLKFIILAGLLPARRVAVLVDEYDQLCRILENSIATAKAARKPGPSEERLKARVYAIEHFGARRSGFANGADASILQRRVASLRRPRTARRGVKKALTGFGLRLGLGEKGQKREARDVAGGRERGLWRKSKGLREGACSGGVPC